MNVLEQIVKNGIVSIIRGSAPDTILPIVRALYQGGVKTVEITLNTPSALQGIEAVAVEMGDRMIVGAGTVLDSESARAALFAGAQFILSPTLDLKTIELTKRYGAVSVPGAFTPTEILAGFQAGADIIKVFPATTLGPNYLKDIHGPLPQIPLMPTGGIDLTNIGAYFQAGAVAVGVGSSLVHKTNQTNDAYLASITEKALQFVGEVRKSRSNEAF